MVAFGITRAIQMQSWSSNKMNSPEHTDGGKSLGANPVNPAVPKSAAPPVSSATPARPSEAARRPRRHIEIAKLLIPLAVLAVLIYLLRAVPDAVLRQEFEGFGAALCAVAYGVILVWRLNRILAPKIPPNDVPDPEETSPATPDLSQNNSSPEASGPAASGLNPVKPGT